jgi:dolichol-phosphate mannosyltransferase
MSVRPLVFIPTYNEAENVGPMLQQLTGLPVEFDVLFIDDGSPDGTGRLLDELSEAYQNVHVLHRSGKLGIGTAHRQGIDWAYTHGYTTLITMDCDFTHPPEKIPELIEGGEGYAVVVGSRYLLRHSLAGWNILRKLLTWTGHTLTVALLGMRYDATGAFRLYRLDRIPRYAFDVVVSRGYSFFFESLYVLYLNGVSIREIPIALPPRTYGHSKMSVQEVFRSVKLLLTIFLLKLLNPEKFRFSEPFARDDAVPSDAQGWEEYWKKEDLGHDLLYDTVAAFYRKVIIRPTLNRFLRRYFSQDAAVLHAGCGGGQVDVDARQWLRITAMDISVNALNFYKRTNGGDGRLLHGSLLAIPLPDGTLDGIYNLGVMEHFTSEEIGAILAEFRRVLKPGGRVVIFWPPEFGLSVRFFKVVKTILEIVLRRTVKLHPDEITRLRSRSHAIGIFEQAGFRVLEYAFGPRDLFTYSIVVAESPGHP